MTVRDGPVESGPVAYIVVYIWCRRSSSQPSHGTAQKNLTDAFSPGVLTPLQRSLRDVHLGATNARTEPRYRFGRPALLPLPCHRPPSHPPQWCRNRRAKSVSFGYRRVPAISASAMSARRLFSRMSAKPPALCPATQESPPSTLRGIRSHKQDAN